MWKQLILAAVLAVSVQQIVCQCDCPCNSDRATGRRLVEDAADPEYLDDEAAGSDVDANNDGGENYDYNYGDDVENYDDLYDNVNNELDDDGNLIDDDTNLGNRPRLRTGPRVDDDDDDVVDTVNDADLDYDNLIEITNGPRLRSRPRATDDNLVDNANRPRLRTGPRVDDDDDAVDTVNDADLDYDNLPNNANIPRLRTLPRVDDDDVIDAGNDGNDADYDNLPDNANRPRLRTLPRVDDDDLNVPVRRGAAAGDGRTILRRPTNRISPIIIRRRPTLRRRRPIRRIRRRLNPLPRFPLLESDRTRVPIRVPIVIEGPGNAITGDPIIRRSNLRRLNPRSRLRRLNPGRTRGGRRVLGGAVSNRVPATGRYIREMTENRETGTEFVGGRRFVGGTVRERVPGTGILRESRFVDGRRVFGGTVRDRSERRRIVIGSVPSGSVRGRPLYGRGNNRIEEAGDGPTPCEG